MIFSENRSLFGIMLWRSDSTTAKSNKALQPWRGLIHMAD
jgi:hypothetical protein